MARKGLRSPLRVLKRFRLYGVTSAAAPDPTGPIQSMEQENLIRFPQQVNRPWDVRQPSS